MDVDPLVQIESLLKQTTKILSDLEQTRQFQNFEEGSKFSSKLENLVEQKKKWEGFFFFFVFLEWSRAETEKLNLFVQIRKKIW